MKKKIAMFCDVREQAIIESTNVDNIYELPLIFHKQGLDDYIIHKFNLACGEADLSGWQTMVNHFASLKQSVTIALVRKYVQLHDAYLSVSEALRHAGLANDRLIDIRWIDSETLNPAELDKVFLGVDGILVPGGFGGRGIEGRLLQHAMHANIISLFWNLFGHADRNDRVCSQCMWYDVCGLDRMVSETPYPVIHLMPYQNKIKELGETLRLGNWPCVIQAQTHAACVYPEQEIQERHRHRYEFNNDYRKVMEEHGVVFSGLSPDQYLVEIAEIKDHPWYVGCQFHPEFKSRPNRPHPLFYGFTKAATQYNENRVQ